MVQSLWKTISHYLPCWIIYVYPSRSALSLSLVYQDVDTTAVGSVVFWFLVGSQWEVPAGY